MQSIIRVAFGGVLCLGLANLVTAGEKQGKAGKDVKAMSQDEQIKLALSAARQ
jgi:hypothetical protein